MMEMRRRKKRRYLVLMALVEVVPVLSGVCDVLGDGDVVVGVEGDAVEMKRMVVSLRTRVGK